MVPKSIVDSNRIMYVDPNDVRGNINGVPLTPDYPNLCIWCNLTVERTSRLKNQGGGVSENEIYVIAFDLSNADYKSNEVSFMQGKDARDYSFYTTDYTNINYEEIKKRNIIEGLQVESVNVSFINYQTPQVTIKFIDIRGGGFFGREEATHNEFGKLSNLETDENQNKFDNFFSCFVSFPYPRFKLQIKGFYGRPVTFQLTCTNFNGNFNSNTGNFEIVVQFIGYEYGILGDIPFDLLVAAPLTDVGSQHWNTQVANMDNNGWALDKDGSEAPPKLLNFYKDISSALQTFGPDEIAEFNQDNDSETTMSGLTDQIKMLGEIQSYQNEIKDLCKKIFKPYYVTEFSDKNENTLIIHSNKAENVFNEDIESLKEKYNIYYKLYKEYREKYENGGQKSTEEVTYNKNFTEFLDHQSKKGNVRDSSNHSNRTSKGVIESDNPASCSGVQINQMFDNAQYTISDGMSKELVKNLSIWNWAIYGGSANDGIPFAKYASAICLGISPSDKITSLQSDYDSYSNKINEFKNNKISTFLHMTPYIGRYFKVVMCHLETFVEVFYKCADAIQSDIKEKRRKPSKLGIYNLPVQTDVPGDDSQDVPPFPSVYKKYNPDSNDDKALMSGKEIVCDAWIGDFHGTTDWREEFLVDSFFKAAMQISDMRVFENQLGNTKTDVITSVFPLDCITTTPKYAYSSIDGMAFYAALRAEITLDFMQRGQAISNDLAYELGMLDGYFYASKCANNEFIKRIYNITNLSDELYKSTVYCDDFRSTTDYKNYEFVKVYNDRHPVFIENGNNVKYNYLTNQSTNSTYVPLESINTINGKNGFSKFYDYDSGTDFVPKNLNSGNFLVGNPNTTSNYTDTAHFVVITNEDKVNGIIETYDKLANGEAKIGKQTSADYINTIKNYSLIGEHSKPKEITKNNSQKQGKFCSYSEMDFLDKDHLVYMNEENVKAEFNGGVVVPNTLLKNGISFTTVGMTNAVLAFTNITY